MKKVLFLLVLAMLPNLLLATTLKVGKFGDWWFNLEVDNFDGSVAYSAVNFDLNSQMTIVIQCFRDIQRTRVTLSKENEYLSSNIHDKILVRHKIGRNPIRSNNWDTVRGEFVMLYGSKAVNFIRGLEGQDVLKFRLTERNGVSHDSSFYLFGIDKVLNGILPACGNKR